jgi:hypothetical protein
MVNMPLPLESLANISVGISMALAPGGSEGPPQVGGFTDATQANVQPGIVHMLDKAIDFLNGFNGLKPPPAITPIPTSTPIPTKTPIPANNRLEFGSSVKRIEVATRSGVKKIIVPNGGVKFPLGYDDDGTYSTYCQSDLIYEKHFLTTLVLLPDTITQEERETFTAFEELTHWPCE